MAKKRVKKAAKKKVAKKPAPKAAKKAAKKSAQAPASGLIGEIRQLLDLMTTNDLSEVHVENGDKRIVLRRGPGGEPIVAASSLTPRASAGAEAPASLDGPPPADHPDAFLEIPSPMVGTFYASASPDSEPYITQGAHIADDTVICIVEAMKVMNEIKAECSGTVVEVCVKNAQPVEYGQVLFKVQPA